jgi:hypothetical protein
MTPQPRGETLGRARAPEPSDVEIGAFKAELQQALADAGQLPGDELFDAVDYGQGSDEAFLRRLWHDLYGDQPCSSDPAPADRTDLGAPGQEASDHRGLDAAYYENLAGRLYGLLIGLEDRLDREEARQLHHFIEVGEDSLALEDITGALAQDKVAITGQERADMLALVRHMGMDELVPRALESCPPAPEPDPEAGVRAL